VGLTAGIRPVWIPADAGMTTQGAEMQNELALCGVNPFCRQAQKFDAP